jgi:hypothetical protein
MLAFFGGDMLGFPYIYICLKTAFEKKTNEPNRPTRLHWKIGCVFLCELRITPTPEIKAWIDPRYFFSHTAACK